MKRTVLFLFATSLSLVAPAQSPVVQAHLQPVKGILVGQPVRLVVTVYVPNYFTGEPAFPEFEMENAIVVLPQDRPANSNTQIGGVRYAGITETYVIYPQQEGDFKLPAAPISVPYATAPPKSTTVQVHLPALTFHADVPAAARDLDYFLPTTSLTVQQKWSAPLKNLRVGDSIERTITVTASKMQAMLIPPLPLQASDGVRIYPEEPVVTDQKTDRGDFIYGRRTQSAKYFLQKEGDYTLPAIELKWWNLSTNRLVTATLPAVHLSVAPNPGYVTELPPEKEATAVAPVQHVSLWKKYRSLLAKVALSCVLLVFLLWSGWPIVPREMRKLKRWRERQLHSEATCFRSLLRACDRNDPPAAYELLLKWLAIANPGVSLEQIIKPAGDLSLTSEIERLGAVLYASDQGAERWNGRLLARLLRRLRASQQALSVHHEHLQELNPESELSTK